MRLGFRAGLVVGGGGVVVVVVPPTTPLDLSCGVEFAMPLQRFICDDDGYW
jgi:hypothetical protein